MFFDADCNEKVFSPKPGKNGTDPSCRLREKRENPLIPDTFQFRKNNVTEPKVRYS